MEINQKVCKLNIDSPYLKQEKPKSQGVIGNITINFTKTFNWLQRKMWKMFFGLEIENLGEQ